MPSSYYINYGTNRLEFQGSGSVAWKYEPIPQSGYYERLLWSGDLNEQNEIARLNAHPSAFDDIRCVAGGVDSVGNSPVYHTFQIPYKELHDTNMWYIENPMFGEVGTNGVNRGWFFGGVLNGCSGQTWSLVSAWGRQFNLTDNGSWFGFTHVRQIWGIHYG